MAHGQGGNAQPEIDRREHNDPASAKDVVVHGFTGLTWPQWLMDSDGTGVVRGVFGGSGNFTITPSGTITVAVGLALPVGTNTLGFVRFAEPVGLTGNFTVNVAGVPTIAVGLGLPAGTNTLGLIRFAEPIGLTGNPTLGGIAGVPTVNVGLGLPAGTATLGFVRFAEPLLAGTATIGLVRFAEALLVGTATIGVARCTGDIVHDAVDSGAPQKIGFKADNTEPTAVSGAADRVDAWGDLQGRLASFEYWPGDATVATVTLASTSNVALAPAPGANTRIIVLTCDAGNDSGTQTRFQLKDGTILRFEMPLAGSGGGFIKQWRRGLVLTANVTLNASLSTAVTSVFVNVEYVVVAT